MKKSTLSSRKFAKIKSIPHGPTTELVRFVIVINALKFLYKNKLKRTIFNRSEPKKKTKIKFELILN